MAEFLANYHTHTFRCGHAVGTEADYARTAAENGWQVLGFSDHMPWPYRGGFTNPTVRMTVEEAPEYLAAVRQLKEQYKGRLHIYLGFECEYFPEYMNWLREVKEAWDLDDLIFADHYDKTDDGGFYYGRCTETAHLISYADNALKGMETGLFRYFAHPDLFLMDYPVFDAAAKDCTRSILMAAKELDIPLEYNLHGELLRQRGCSMGLGYPCREFWELAAENGNSAVIGADAHSLTELADTAAFRKAQRTLQSMGIKVLPCLEGLE